MTISTVSWSDHKVMMSSVIWSGEHASCCVRVSCLSVLIYFLHCLVPYDHDQHGLEFSLTIAISYQTKIFPSPMKRKISTSNAKLARIRSSSDFKTALPINCNDLQVK